jgi:hypothetical protein
MPRLQTLLLFRKVRRRPEAQAVQPAPAVARVAAVHAEAERLKHAARSLLRQIFRLIAAFRSF